MLDTTQPLRIAIDGVPHWQYLDGRALPVMAGAEDPEDGRRGSDDPAGDPPRTDPREPDPEPRGDPRDEPLGDNGKKALDDERAARRAAERRARTAEAEAKRLREAQMSEAERLRQQAEEGRKLGATGTDKLRRANLVLALADKGLKSPKAAAKLLDRVEYDDEDEPTNLDAAIKAAKAEYGDELFKGVGRRSPDLNGGGGGSPRERPTLTAEQLEMAELMGQAPEEYAAHLKDAGAGALGAPPRKRT